ncbi:hypothetical protein RUM44_013604 [Polyplax serrata]|uniref:Myosin motor domain-containing protein n=1 Tax=Polyplax serrata TaxID=468196 RepID=A0ABR1BGI9_POLSC
MIMERISHTTPGDKMAKTEEDLANEKAWLDAEKRWLVHRGGFTSVRVLPNIGDNQATDMGKIKVKIENTNEILEVDEDDLEKANPNQLDKIEDISHLRYINESSVLYLLRQRFGNNLIHTYAAGNLIVINPQCTLSIYNEKVAALFRGCKSEDMPPHIYAMAQTTYRSMLSSRKDQSIVLLGRSGSGKTHNFRHILSYLLHSAGSLNKVLTLEKLNALHTVLEAFGNARTCLNVNATRCTNLVSLDFDQTGQIASLAVQMLMLEKHRVVRRPEGEGIFNVFYWLLAGAESSLAKQLLVDTTTTQNSNLFMSSIYKGKMWKDKRNEDRQRATMELTKLTLALNVLGISDKECFIIWSILAVIYHLGNASTVRVGTNKWQFADPVHASRACRLMGTTTEELSQVLWDGPPSPTRTPSPAEKDKIVTGAEALEGFVVGLYSEVVNVVNNLLNRCLTTNVHSTMSMIIVDSPGLQNPGSCGQQRGASFSDLCHNYVQERLHLLFHNVCLVAPHDRYTQEHIDVNTEEMNSELNLPNQLVSILDKSPPSGVLKTSQTDLREIDRRGLLWLLDEESLYPNSGDETFLQRLFQHYGGKDHQLHIRKTSGVGHFIIQHLQGTSPVIYNGNGLLKASKENSLTRSANSFLQESTKEEISELFIKTKGGFLTSGTESSQSLRRVSSIRRTCSVAIKRKSLSLQVKFTTDSLIETLRRTRPRFVFCLLAHHNAGNTEITPGPTAVTGENILNVPLLRSQVRGSEILPAVRLFKQGFPEFFPHGEFKRRFRLLASGCGNGSSAELEENNSAVVKITVNGQPQPTEALDEARAVEEMLLMMDVDISSYRIGLTQVALI